MPVKFLQNGTNQELYNGIYWFKGMHGFITSPMSLRQEGRMWNPNIKRLIRRTLLGRQSAMCRTRQLVQRLSNSSQESYRILRLHARADSSNFNLEVIVHKLANYNSTKSTIMPHVMDFYLHCLGEESLYRNQHA